MINWASNPAMWFHVPHSLILYEHWLSTYYVPGLPTESVAYYLIKFCVYSLITNRTLRSHPRLAASQECARVAPYSEASFLMAQGKETMLIIMTPGLWKSSSGHRSKVELEFRLQEFRSVLSSGTFRWWKCPKSAVSNTVTTSSTWLLSTWGVASVTEALNAFDFICIYCFKFK